MTKGDVVMDALLPTRGRWTAATTFSAPVGPHAIFFQSNPGFLDSGIRPAPVACGADLRWSFLSASAA
jgi:hypothetical protein